MITMATLAVSPDRSAAVWITGRRGHANLTHLAAVIFDDVDEEYERVQQTLAHRYLYAPAPAAATYARALGLRPAAIRNLREPARALQAAVWASHRDQVCCDPSVQHPEPRMRPIPGHDLRAPGSELALMAAPLAANHLLAMWQAWLDAECERALRHRLGSADLEGPDVRIVPDEFVLAEQLVAA
ncbi:hypothetical protein ASE12_08665 [Aeromicrobium sp. Root236]|uniref:hypothetical protein n=1 Tax=Aeromicrobium sp. Root236 TaxID=1736498 RepID=UPI0006FB3EBE|nr:hypothetical protein [Aeromicrobium sp. Root236]KRC64835.1 hypothetical protein ASE12_08665 [Aeromicrobium sp. Root236]